MRTGAAPRVGAALAAGTPRRVASSPARKGVASGAAPRAETATAACQTVTTDTPRRVWATVGNGGRADRERGSGTALVLGVVGVGLVLLAMVTLLVGVVRARAQAQTAADLAAVAAATAWFDPVRGDPCMLARRVAAESGADLVACAVNDGQATVSATVPTPLGAAFAQARAGPADR